MSLQGPTKQRSGEELLAVALRYADGKDAAPRLVAKGKRKLAEKIISIAKEKGVPIKEDRNLGQALYKLELDETIPEELYKAVAEVLAFLLFVEKSRSARTRTDVPEIHSP